MPHQTSDIFSYIITVDSLQFRSGEAAFIRGSPAHSLCPLYIRPSLISTHAEDKELRFFHHEYFCPGNSPGIDKKAEVRFLGTSNKVQGCSDIFSQ